VGTLHGFGPFTAGNVQESLVLLQMFMGVVSVTGLVLATAIQERARAEEELKAADRRKDEFLAMLAHELRNPLAPIRNALHVLSTSPAESGNRMKDLVGVMSRQVDHLVRLVDDLLDASRIIQEKVQFRPETVRLMTVIERRGRPLIQPLPPASISFWSNIQKNRCGSIAMSLAWPRCLGTF
jgi:signal transduction histidine kinase